MIDQGRGRDRAWRQRQAERAARRKAQRRPRGPACEEDLEEGPLLRCLRGRAVAEAIKLWITQEETP